jgi:hypothetical protein
MALNEEVKLRFKHGHRRCQRLPAVFRDVRSPDLLLRSQLAVAQQV